MKKRRKILNHSGNWTSLRSLYVFPLSSAMGRLWWVQFKKAPKNRKQPFRSVEKTKRLKSYDRVLMSTLITPAQQARMTFLLARIHQSSQQSAPRWLFWVSADNVRKGAALERPANCSTFNGQILKKKLEEYHLCIFVKKNYAA